MIQSEARGAEVLRTIMTVGRETFAAEGIELPNPIADGGGPSSTFTGAAFSGMLLGIPCWGPHVAVRIPDAAYDLATRHLIGPHIGVFRQLFFSLPVAMVAPRDPEVLTRTLMTAITRALFGEAEEVIYRAYPWNANSTRMAGVAREVNLASGVIRGMEICQLNHIEQAGGVKLEQPSYLIVVGADRLAYALSLHNYYQQGAELGSVEEFYRLDPSRAEALTALHSSILHENSGRAAPLREALIQELESLERELTPEVLPSEPLLARFRKVNILLETLFMIRGISGALRQSYIGRIGDLAKQIAAAILNHPEQGRCLATETQVSRFEQALERTEALLLSAPREATRTPVSGSLPELPTSDSLPQAVIHWHAEQVTQGIDQDLPGCLSEAQQSALREWIVTHYHHIGPAVRTQGESDLPLGFAAIRVAEEQIILSRDLAMEAEEVRNHLTTLGLVGGNGAQRQARMGRLLAVLAAQGVEIPPLLQEYLPFLGIEQVFFSSRIFERTILVIVEEWFERHLPTLKAAYLLLREETPPSSAAERHCWAAIRLELASRYLLVRAAAGKPLWQDPYGARYILNHDLLPLWRDAEYPEPLRLALIEAALEGESYPDEVIERVRNYLVNKRL